MIVTGKKKREEWGSMSSSTGTFISKQKQVPIFSTLTNYWECRDKVFLTHSSPIPRPFSGHCLEKDLNRWQAAGLQELIFLKTQVYSGAGWRLSTQRCCCQAWESMLTSLRTQTAFQSRKWVPSWTHFRPNFTFTHAFFTGSEDVWPCFR